MKNLGSRIKQIEKVLGEESKGDIERRRKEKFADFLKRTPNGVREILCEFFRLIVEISSIERYRPEPEPQRIQANFLVCEALEQLNARSLYYFCSMSPVTVARCWNEFNFIPLKAVEKFGKLTPKEQDNMNRGRAKAELENVISSSDDLALEAKDDFLKILFKPFSRGDNVFREILGLPPLDAEEGPKV